MKLYVFYFSRVTKEVVRDEVEVESMSKEEFIALIGQDVVVDYNFLWRTATVEHEKL